MGLAGVAIGCIYPLHLVKETGRLCFPAKGGSGVVELEPPQLSHREQRSF